MTLSYKIIKSGNVNVSAEGIKVSNNIPVRKVEPKKEINTIKDASEDTNKRHFLSESEKEALIDELRAGIEAERKEILSKASEDVKAEAEKVIALAREKGYEEGYEEGYEKGLSSGHEEGYDKALKDGQCIIDDAHSMLSGARAEMMSYFEAQKEKMLMLAGRMAEKITNSKIESSSQTIIDMMSPLIMEFRNGGTVVISCSDEIVEKIRDDLPLLEKINKDLDYMVIVNPKLKGYEFSLEYGNQIVDMNTKKQIESMIEEFLNLEV